MADSSGHDVLAGTVDGDFGLTRVQRWVGDGLGIDGRVVTDFGGDDDAAHGVAVLPDLRVLVAGGNASSMTLWRLNPDGSTDGSSGSGAWPRSRPTAPPEGWSCSPTAAN